MEAKYKVIYEDVKKRIATGEYAVGSKIPDEFTFCEQYQCSRMTVKKALDLLVEEGFLYRKQGQGSFVLNQQLSDGRIEISERELSGLTRSSKGKATAKLIRFSLIFASKNIAEKLDIHENDPVYDILRLRLVDGQPYVLEHTYMSPQTIPGITEEVLNKSVYTYIEETLGKRIGAAHKMSYADCSTKQDQETLDLKPTEPVLVVEQIAYLDNGAPFEYSISRHRYDRFRFSVYSLRR